MAADSLHDIIVHFIQHELRNGVPSVAAGAIQAHANRPRSTVNRALFELLQEGRIERHGAGRSVSYSVPVQAEEARPEQPDEPVATVRQWRPEGQELIRALTAPLGTRQPVTYRRSFVDDYKPNETSLLPPLMAKDLYDKGRAKDQLPAGTYARKVLEQLLIDLSWFSSRLEGNRKSLLDTRVLFEKGRSAGDDRDSTMLLNHKDAIEFMVDAVPTEGITVPVVRNFQSLLMRDLLADPADLGAIRHRVVNIQDTVYVPSQVPDLLEEMLGLIVDKARHIRNPVEAAFFFWVNIAYLQPFVDGNKRTSRLSANLPLMVANCAPLSFIDVEQTDYAMAMLGVYEKLDVTLAVELFDWTYRRSIEKYQVVVDAMGAPDPLRVRYREQLSEAIQQVVFYGNEYKKALVDLDVPDADKKPFTEMLLAELDGLQTYNCARYRLPIKKTQEWIEQGRPR